MLADEPLTSGLLDSRARGSSSASALLRVRGLSVDYRSRAGGLIPALRDIDLEVAEQEIVGVLGESGSGKSSLSRAILRLLPPNGDVVAGKVEYRGTDLLTMTDHELRQVRGADIALISQEPALALNPVLPIARQMIDVLRAHRRVSHQKAMEQAEIMLREVGFPEPARILRAYPHQLSGGQRQRTAIAQALICSPSLLIADEPLSSLDTITQAELLDLLQRLKRGLKLAMIFVTHSAGVLSSLADRVVVMHGGRVCAQGALNLLGREEDAYVRGLIFPEKAVVPRKNDSVLGAASVTTAQLVQVRNASKQFSRRHLLSRRKFQVQALAGIDLEINEAATIAVIGRSGSGKTTLARCIAGFESPDAGEITFRDTGFGGTGAVQLMFQDAGTALNPRFTAAEVIREPLDIARRFSRAERTNRALQLMEEVGLDPDWAARRAGEFSGGQRQRLALARALAASPRLLILDESLSGLDLPLQAQMLQLLTALQERHGLAYLHITHDLNFLPLFADEVLVMEGGTIVERSSPSALLQSSHPVTRHLIEAGERLRIPGLEVAL